MTTESITARSAVTGTPPAAYRDNQGVWHVCTYAEARTILMAEVRQAGFKAEVVDKIPMRMEKPVLFQDGAAHREQRVQTARFFTPAAVQQRYLPLIETQADQILADFARDRQSDLNKMAARMAISVVGEVVGLNASPSDEMAVRLDTLLHANLDVGLSLSRLGPYLRLQWLVMQFLWKDVRPAVKARRAAPREDLISHLLSKGYGEAGILAEMITYGAAGMVTTQEFICVATLHLLKNPGLMEQFLQGEQPERYRVLYEILRLEPVVGHLFRVATGELRLPNPSGGETVIPAGAKINLHLYEINADASVVGEEPLQLNPRRPLEKGVHPSIMGFGNGPHRCVGEYLAIAETDVFLRKLLVMPGLRIVQEPQIGLNESIQGYELRKFMIALGS